jgi:beta-lactam-binding protein with PASTA domain
MVTDQLPAANAVIAADSQIIIYCGTEPSEGFTNMPDVTNLTYSHARQMLGTQAVFIRARGPITDPAQIIVIRQDVPPGTPVRHGAVIEVTVVDTRDQGQY